MPDCQLLSINLKSFFIFDFHSFSIVCVCVCVWCLTYISSFSFYRSVTMKRSVNICSACEAHTSMEYWCAIAHNHHRFRNATSIIHRRHQYRDIVEGNIQFLRSETINKDTKNWRKKNFFSCIQWRFNCSVKIEWYRPTVVFYD